MHFKQSQRSSDLVILITIPLLEYWNSWKTWLRHEHVILLLHELQLLQGCYAIWEGCTVEFIIRLYRQVDCLFLVRKGSVWMHGISVCRFYSTPLISDIIWILVCYNWGTIFSEAVVFKATALSKYWLIHMWSPIILIMYE